MADRPAGQIDVYHVGLLANLRHILGAARTGHRREAWSLARYVTRSLGRQVRTHNWHGLRMQLNGYLAEPQDWAPYAAIGVRRCGSGWTPRRARRSLDRQVRRALRSAR